jgi:hypothetical protein
MSSTTYDFYMVVTGQDLTSEAAANQGGNTVKFYFYSSQDTGLLQNHYAIAAGYSSSGEIVMNPMSIPGALYQPIKSKYNGTVSEYDTTFVEYSSNAVIPELSNMDFSWFYTLPTSRLVEAWDLAPDTAPQFTGSFAHSKILITR